MPFNATGGWVPWSCNITQNGTVDPISGSVACATSPYLGLGVILVIFFAGLYLFAWVRFSSAPSRFKMVAISAAVFSIAAVAVLGGLLSDAVLFFIVFAISFFISALFKR